MASAAAPTCSVPAPKQVRTDTLAWVLPACGLAYNTPATYEITTPPAHGSARVSSELGGTTLRYLPADGYAGPDSFAFRVVTADGPSAPVTQQLTMSPDVNTTPVCSTPSPGNLRVRRGASRTFTLSCNDRDGDPLTYALTSAPQHATVVFGREVAAGREVTITPTGSFTGTDSFGYRATESRGASDVVPVAFEIVDADANSAPVCSPSYPGPQTVRTSESQWVVTLGCTDAEGDPVGIEVVSGPSHGSATSVEPAAGFQVPMGRTVPYTPIPGYTGPDSFTVRGRDNRSATSGTFTINVTVAAPPQQTVGCDAPSTITLRPGTKRRIFGACRATAPAGYEVLAPPAHGTVVKRDGFVYTPQPGYTGPDSFKYRILSVDGSGPEVTQPLLVTPSANDAPSCWVGLPGRSAFPPSGVETVVRAGEAADVSFSCLDNDGDPVTVDVDAPTHGAISGFSPLVPSVWEAFSGRGRYTSTPGYVGFDAIRIQGNDGHGGSAQGVTQLVVRGASYNSAPSCAFASTPSPVIAGTEAELTYYCGDAEGDPVKLEVVTAPAHVSLGPVDGTGGLRPASVLKAPAGFAGADAFELRPVDGRGAKGPFMGTIVTVIPDPGPVDRQVSRGGTVGAELSALPTPTQPANVRLTTLNQGRVIIVPGNASAPSGWNAVGLSFAITAPDAIPEAPLMLRFRLDGSQRIPGEKPESITVFRNGQAVADCTGDGASPDPCVTSRAQLAGDDLEIVVLSSKASAWSFGRASIGTPPGTPTGGGSSGPGGTVGEAGGGNFGNVGGSSPQPQPQPTPPTLTLGALPKLRAALAKGFQVKLTSTYAGTARAKLTLDGKTAKRVKLSKGKPVAVATGTTSAAAGRPTTITLRFTKAAKRALAKAKKVTFTLQAGVNDGPVMTKTLTLKR